MLSAVLTFVVSRTLGNWKLKGNLSLLPLSFIPASAADWLEGWTSDTLTLCHRQRELRFSHHFTFHPCLLYKNYCYCTLHLNTVPNWWLQPRKYLFRAGTNLLPFPLLDLKAFSDSPGRKIQVSAGELQLSQRNHAACLQDWLLSALPHLFWPSHLWLLFDGASLCLPFATQ